MSATPSIDAYDAQMLDFSSDPDVPMNMNSAEFFAEALMDHDGHLASTYSEHPSVEIDMEEYVGDNAEYEMADETAEYQRPHGDELLDIEVYDASHAPSPLVPLHHLQPSVDVPIGSEHREARSQTYSEHAPLPELQDESEPEVHPAPHDHPAADVSHVEPSASAETVSLEAVTLERSHSSDVPDEGLAISESHEQLHDLSRAEGQLFEAPVPAGTDAKAEPLVSPVAEGLTAHPETVQHANLGLPTAESATLVEDADAASAAVREETAADQVPTAGEESADPLHISDDAYIDSPPPVLLSVADDPEPGFALFTPPDVGGESLEEHRGNQKGFALLLEDRPTLYYEPLSSVFETLRQDEGLLSRVPHSFEGELVLDAYDLHLAVSEDNVHSREISLHDMNILHDGSDFVGPLRLHLRAIVPRFIIRYYALQEQIQRLHVTAETGDGEHDEEHHENYETVEERPLSQQEEDTKSPYTQGVTVSEGSEAPPTTEVEPAKELVPPRPTEEAPQESYEPADTFATEEPAAEYHEAAGDATHVLEVENDYQGTNVGDEDESAKFDNLDADPIHDVAEDTYAQAIAAGQDLEFGGEQIEYLGYAHSEESDERYGEDLPERAGGASAAQYGEPPHYEEGEHYPLTTAEEVQTVLPDSDDGEGDQSAATPIPPRTVPEPESVESIAVNTTSESVTPKQESPEPSGEEPATSESKSEVGRAQTSGNQEPSTAQARVFSEVDESDSNFVKLLEREADAEFDQTFHPEQNGQQSNIEATLQHDETWDEWDDEDAEGDDEEDWIDPDAESNESSITLASKVSSKRNYDQVDPGEEPIVENAQNSPGPKRLRVE